MKSLSATTHTPNPEWATIAFNFLGSMVWLWMTCLGTALFGFIFLAPMIGLLSIYFLKRPKFAVIFTLTSLIYQNFFISLASPNIESSSIFSAMQGINFLTLALLGLSGFYQIRTQNLFHDDPLISKITKGILFFMIAAGLYLAYGAALNGATNSISYFRNFVNGLLLLSAGLYLGLFVSKDFIYRACCFIGITLLAYGLLERIFEIDFYDFINLHEFYTLKRQNGMSIYEVINSNRITLFNSPWLQDLNLTSIRLFGPNSHTISYAYFLAFSAIVFAIRKFYLGTIAAILLIASMGAKGPLIMIFIALFFYVGSQQLRTWNPPTLAKLFYAFLALYITLTIIVGINSSDYHILGLIGGLRGFLSNPIGHGFGSGGNISASKGEAAEAVDWQLFQQDGSASFGLESSVGVLLYQWGVFGALFYAFLIYISYKLITKALTENRITPNRDILLYASFSVICANFVFQEEALSPAASGIVLFTLGIILASSSTSQKE